MSCVNVIAADSTEEAHFLSTSFLQLATGIVTGRRAPLPPPVTSMDGLWSEHEQAAVYQMMRYAFIGDSKTVVKGLSAFCEEAAPDEIMVTTNIYDPAKRIHSYEVLKDAIGNA